MDKKNLRNKKVIFCLLFGATCSISLPLISTLMANNNTKSNISNKAQLRNNTSAKTIVNVAEITPVIDGVSQLTYAIDVAKDATVQQKIIDSINAHPENYFNFPPNAVEQNSRPIVDPTRPASFSLVQGGDQPGTQIRMNFFGLQKNGSTTDYVETNILLTGFNVRNTYAISTYIDVPYEFRYRLPTEISPSNPTLINFIKLPSTLRRVFRNISNTFINDNANKIRINSILKQDNKNGSLWVNVSVFNAKTDNGYESISANLKFKGFNRNNSSTSLIDSIDVNDLGIYSLNNDVYSLDVIDSEHARDIQRQIFGVVNNYSNINKFLISSPTKEQLGSNPIFRQLNFNLDQQNENCVRVSGEFACIKSGSNELVYEQGSFLITGFNDRPTDVFKYAINQGILVPGISSVSVANFTMESAEAQRIKEYIQNNLTSIFTTFPERFLTVNRNNIAIKLLKKNPVDYTVDMSIGVQFASTGLTYEDKTFRVVIRGFRKNDVASYPKTIIAEDLAKFDLTAFGTIKNEYASEFVKKVNNDASLLGKLSSIISNNPTFFFDNTLDSNQPIIEPGSQIRVVQSDTYSQVDIYGRFLQWRPGGGFLDLFYQDMVIPIVKFNTKPTTIQNTTFNQLFDRLGISKILYSNTEAEDIVNDTKLQELCDLINNNANQLLPPDANNIPASLKRLIESRTLSNPRNTRAYALGKTDLEIIISNIPIASSENLGQVINGSLSVVVPGFLTSNKNTVFLKSYIDAQNDLDQFKAWFPDTKTFTIDWQEADPTVIEEQLKTGMNNNRYTFFENFANLEPVKKVTITDINTDKNYADVVVTYSGFADGYYDPAINLSAQLKVLLRGFPKAKDLSESFSQYVGPKIKSFITNTNINANTNINEYKDRLTQNIITWVNEWVLVPDNAHLWPEKLLTIPIKVKANPLVNNGQPIQIDKKVTPTNVYYNIRLLRGGIIIGPHTWNIFLPDQEMSYLVDHTGILYPPDFNPDKNDTTTNSSITGSLKILVVAAGIIGSLGLLGIILAIIYAKSKHSRQKWVDRVLGE